MFTIAHRAALPWCKSLELLNGLTRSLSYGILRPGNNSDVADSHRAVSTCREIARNAQQSGTNVSNAKYYRQEISWWSSLKLIVQPAPIGYAVESHKLLATQWCHTYRSAYCCQEIDGEAQLSTSFNLVAVESLELPNGCVRIVRPTTVRKSKFNASLQSSSNFNLSNR
jgi:hypothetical protein